MRPVLMLMMSAVLFIGCLFARHSLESDPVSHVLVLLPLLALAGWLIAAGLGANDLGLKQENADAITVLSVFVVLFWMLPRYIDASLTDPFIAIAKFTSIPVCIGFALAISWKSTHPFLRGFLKANALSMLGVMAFLYTHAPVRICNSYLVEDQQRLGQGFLLAAIALALLWAFPLFFPPGRRTLADARPVGKVAA